MFKKIVVGAARKSFFFYFAVPLRLKYKKMKMDRAYIFLSWRATSSVTEWASHEINTESKNANRSALFRFFQSV